MLKVLIIDDEIKNCQSVKTVLERNCSNATIAGIATQADAAIELIKKTDPDIIFLDIQMPYKTGFELLELFQLRTFETIFITAYEQYAVKAFKEDALDYILKPFTETEIINAFQKAEKRIQEKTAARLHTVSQAEKTKNNILTLPTAEGFEFVNLQHIMYCNAEDSYTWFILADNTKILVSANLHYFEKQLEPHGFHRIHNSHLVNIRYVKKYVKGRGGHVIMHDGQSIDVSVRKKAEFFEKLLL